MSGLERLTSRLGRERSLWAIAILVGGAAFIAWIGYARTLDPRDLSWIFHEDPFGHVMGWEQFRHAPLLQYPITKNTAYGLEWSSTLVYADAIPIAALLLRPLSAILPHPFQYLGWWGLLSMVLQAYWGARLVLLRSDRLRDAAIGAVFFVTTPVLLERLGLQTALGSQWLLLWALWLYFCGRGVQVRSWGLVLLLAVSIHAYLFVMVGAIWVAHLYSCRMRGELRGRDLLIVAGTLIAVVAWMHTLGYFVVGDGVAGGGWRSSFDLIGFVAPARGAQLGLAPGLETITWDGSAYLGAGILALLVASAVARMVRRRPLQASVTAAHWLPLIVCVGGLALFAVTNNVTIANHRVVSFSLPNVLVRLYETFRGAQRMVWPAYYVVLLATLWFALRAWPARVRSFVLVGALLVQLADLRGVAAIKREELHGPGMTRPLVDPLWAVVAQHYERFVSVPAKYWQTDWPTIAWFAANHGLACNVAYVSRSNAKARAEGARQHLSAVVTGHFEPRTAYYVPGTLLWQVARHAMGPRDLAAVADGMQLILPGARAWTQVADLPPPPEVPGLGEWIEFGRQEHDGLLLDGWSWRETWGTWSGTGTISMILPAPRHARVRVTFRWMAAAPPRMQQTIQVSLGNEVFDANFPRPMVERQHSFVVTTSDSGLLDIHLDVPPMGPSEQNTRAVGVGLIAARVQLASEPEDIPPAGRRPPVLDTWISFSAGAAGRDLLVHGWSWGEEWGTWSDEPDPSLVVPVPAGERVRISLRWLATAPPGTRQSARVYVDDQRFDIELPADGKHEEHSFEVVSQRPWVKFKFDIHNPVTLSDGRMLGIGLEGVRVSLFPLPSGP